MAHTYDGQPDARLQDKAVSRFRPTYRQLTDEEKALHDAIKEKAAELEALFEQTRQHGRYAKLALTSLEQAVMWIVKELTS
jgi:hypothetical protein